MKKKRQTVARQAAARRPLPELPKELLDQLVKGPMTPAEVQDLMLAFNKAVIERAMGAEMNLHLGYPPDQPKPPGQANERNGASGKTVITDGGPVRGEVPRDRDGFEPKLIPKHERRFTGFDERIIAMYARGMSVREIRGFLAEHYGTEVSPDFISSVTDEVMAEALSWQSCPVEAMYPVVFFDALRVKIRDDGVVSNKAVYLALGIQADGQRDVLGPLDRADRGGQVLAQVLQRLPCRLFAGMDLTKTMLLPLSTAVVCANHWSISSLGNSGNVTWRENYDIRRPQLGATVIAPSWTPPSLPPYAEHPLRQRCPGRLVDATSIVSPNQHAARARRFRLVIGPKSVANIPRFLSCSFGCVARGSPSSRGVSDHPIPRGGLHRQVGIVRDAINR
ncbi:IS256 family transposase [Burkholderia pseudomultivorans]|uniref:IS256 family transposase n=1 Tax=Burkholderia pseudomultivorans TaxID=1207504 RepID=UPI0018C8D261|nr:transposase [Burkholderia pseudomultivorans]